MKENRYTMPQQFVDDPNVALKWKLYAYLNGFWISGKTVYARNDTLAKAFNKSERAIQSALGELEVLGLITRDIKGLSRYILPGGLKQEGRSPASPLHEAQLHQGDEAQLHHISDSISDSLKGSSRFGGEGETEYEKPTKVIPVPYSIEKTIAVWEDGEVRLQVLNWYFKESGIWSKAITRERLKAMMARHNKAAVRIANAGWKPAELKKAKDQILDNPKMEREWTLETVEKYLTK